MMASLRGMVIFIVVFLMVMAGVSAREHRFSVGITTRGFVGIKAEYEYRGQDGIGIGMFYQGSLLMFAQGDMDTGELGFSLHLEADDLERLLIESVITAGFRYQEQSLGFSRSFFTDTAFRLGLRSGPYSIALESGWEQTWIMGIVYSDFVKETFEDIGTGFSAPPAGTVLMLPASRFRTGITAGINLTGVVSVSINGGLLITPNPFAGGFEGMMFGLFPFYGGINMQLIQRGG